MLEKQKHQGIDKKNLMHRDTIIKTSQIKSMLKINI